MNTFKQLKNYIELYDNERDKRQLIKEEIAKIICDIIDYRYITAENIRILRNHFGIEINYTDHQTFKEKYLKITFHMQVNKVSIYDRINNYSFNL